METGIWSSQADSQVRKALVAVTIEQTLTEIGEPVLEKVSNKLYQDYGCYIPDCYEKPEYLNRVLKDLFGNSHVGIVETICKRLDDFAAQKPIAKFLEQIVS